MVMDMEDKGGRVTEIYFLGKDCYMTCDELCQENLHNAKDILQGDQKLEQQIASQINRSIVRSTDQKTDRIIEQSLKNQINKSKDRSADQKTDPHLKSQCKSAKVGSSDQKLDQQIKS